MMGAHGDGEGTVEELMTVGALGLGALIITTAIILLSARLEPRQVAALEVAADDEHRQH